MARPGTQPLKLTGRDIRSLMFGVARGAVVVERQAWRVWPEDSDELVVVGHGSDFWVACRRSDQVTVWACGDEVHADQQFDRLAGAEDGWVEARPDKQAS